MRTILLCLTGLLLAMPAQAQSTCPVRFQWDEPNTAPDGYVLEWGITQGQPTASHPFASLIADYTVDMPAGTWQVALRVVDETTGLLSGRSNSVRVVCTPGGPQQEIPATITGVAGRIIRGTP